MKKLYRENKYKYGNYLEVNLYPVYLYPRTSCRKRKRRASKPAQVRLNQLRAERSLARLLANNFDSTAIKCELTYTDANLPESIDRAHKDFTNFVRRLNRARERNGLDKTKYVYSLEVGSKKGRIHFHVVLSGGLSLREIQQKWGKGYVDKVLPLMFDETGLKGIAKYFCKQKVDEDGNVDGKYKKRYVASKNCIVPQASNNDYKFSKKRVKEIVEESENLRAIEALYPGYFCAECKPFWNDNNGEYYITIMLYSKTADLDIRTGGQ